MELHQRMIINEQQLSCRFYSNTFPNAEDTVMVNVHFIDERLAYVHLLEYNNIRGMILLSELSRRRIRSVNKLLRIGRKECLHVIRVDEKRRHINLSKIRVNAQDVIQCKDRFAKAKVVRTVLRQVAKQLGLTRLRQLENLLARTAWYFDQKYGEKTAAYDVFKKAFADPTVLDECDISTKTRRILLAEIRKKFAPHLVKIRADIEVSCFAYEGIDAVKSALIAGRQCSTDEVPIKINLIATPLFCVSTKTLERIAGLTTINCALNSIKETIESLRGTFKIVMEPKEITVDMDEME